MIVGKFIEQARVSNGLVAQDTNGGKTTNYFSLGNYAHLTLVLSLGNIAANSTLTVIQSKTLAGATTKVLAVDRYYRMTGLTNEVISEVTGIVGTVGMTAGMSSGLLVLEIDAQDLDVAGGYNCVALNFSNPGNSNFIGVVGIGTGARYKGDAPSKMLS